MKKEVIVVQPHGYCGNQYFGVQRAIMLVKKTAKTKPNQTYLLGEVVHNQKVVDWLEKKYKVKTVHHLKEIPCGATVIIRAHGASPSVYKEAKARKLKVIDATCPLVYQVHREVRELVSKGKKIVYLASSMDHDEAVGVKAEAPQSIRLITLKDLDSLKIKEPAKVVVLTQTTLSILETEPKLRKLKKKYPKITIKPHICLATTERQKAVINLAKEIGFVVIVGSQTSSNSMRLKEVAEKVGARAYLVNSASELKPNWFENIKKVAVSSGASTPEWLLDQVVKKIEVI